MQTCPYSELVDTLLQMGLKDAAATIAKDLGVSLPSTPVQSSIDVGMSAARLQLEHMGHLLTRPVSDVEDSRVGFRPDLWQQRLLDVIDNNESALVCAPTSSGMQWAAAIVVSVYRQCPPFSLHFCFAWLLLSQSVGLGFGSAAGASKPCTTVGTHPPWAYPHLRCSVGCGCLHQQSPTLTH